MAERITRRALVTPHLSRIQWLMAPLAHFLHQNSIFLTKRWEKDK